MVTGTELLENENKRALQELEKHKAESARIAAGREQELANERQAKEQALLLAQQKKLDSEKREYEIQLARQRADNERLSLLEAERKKAESEKAELENSLRNQHEKEMERLKEDHMRKLLESQLAVERERAKREADLQQSKLASEEKVKELTRQQKEAESASSAGSDQLKTEYEAKLKTIADQLAKGKASHI